MQHHTSPPARPSLALSLGLLAALSAHAFAADEPNSGSTVRLAPHTFADPGMGGMKSHTVLVPNGWTADGGAFWANAACFNVLPSQDIRVSSPDGFVVHIEPSFVAREFVFPPSYGIAPPPRYSVDQGYPVIPLPAGLEGWSHALESEFIPAAIPGAKHVHVDNAVVIPELTYELRRLYAPVMQMLQQNQALDASMGLRTSGDCVVLGFETRYTVGRESFEELRVLALTYYTMESEMTGRQTIWSVERALTYRAPKGRLNERLDLMKAIADSVQMTPEWFRMRVDLQAKLLKISSDAARQSMEESRKRSAIIAQSGRDLNDIIMSGYREREAIQDRTHEKVIHAIRGTEEYVTPGGGESVHLPNTYEHVYSNGNGEYLLTNDHLYEPNTDMALDSNQWTRMQARQ